MSALEVISIIGLIASLIGNTTQFLSYRKVRTHKIEMANKEILDSLIGPIIEKAFPDREDIGSLINHTIKKYNLKKGQLYSIDDIVDAIISYLYAQRALQSSDKLELIESLKKKTRIISEEEKEEEAKIEVAEKEKKLEFHDDFEEFNGWINYAQGKVVQSSEHAHTGEFSLKKDLKGDFHGGYKKLENKIILSDKYYIIFSGWIYRDFIPSPNLGDRLAIENSSFSGYGFCINHSNNKIWIERRDNGKPTVISTICDCYVAKNKWYYFEFFMKKASFKLRIWKEGGEIEGVIEELDSFIDMSYSSFDRIAVHGGFPYYVDDIKIEKIV